jgi:hypothetical protein
MADLSPLLGEERKSDFGAVRSVDDDQKRTSPPHLWMSAFGGEYRPETRALCGLSSRSRLTLRESPNRADELLEHWRRIVLSPGKPQERLLVPPPACADRPRRSFAGSASLTAPALCRVRSQRNWFVCSPRLLWGGIQRGRHRAGLLG